MRLIIAGSRTFCCSVTWHNSNPLVSCQECTDKARQIWHVMFMYTDFLNDEHRPLEIVSGRAKGADMVGELFAKKMNFSIKEFPAKWRVGGKVNMAAGFERNQEMANYADAAIVLWDGTSRGALHMHKTMLLAKKPSILYNFVAGKIE